MAPRRQPLARMVEPRSAAPGRRCFGHRQARLCLGHGRYRHRWRVPLCRLL